MLFIEYQNEFVSEGGKLYEAVKDVLEQTDMIAKSATIAAKARTAGVKVFHSPITFKEDASDNPNKALGILAGAARVACHSRGARVPCPELSACVLCALQAARTTSSSPRARGTPRSARRWRRRRATWLCRHRRALPGTDIDAAPSTPSMLTRCGRLRVAGQEGARRLPGHQPRGAAGRQRHRDRGGCPPVPTALGAPACAAPHAPTRAAASRRAPAGLPPAGPRRPPHQLLRRVDHAHRL